LRFAEKDPEKTRFFTETSNFRAT